MGVKPLFLFSICFLAMACSLIPNSGEDIGLFEGECVEACWQGLRPGQSTRDDVTEFLDRHRSDITDLMVYGRYEFDYKDGVHVRFDMTTNRLTRIYIRGRGDDSIDLSLEDILQALGQPTYITVEQENGPIGYFYLYYPEAGFYFSGFQGYWAGNGHGICFDTDTQVETVVILPSGSIEDLIEGVYWPPSLSDEAIALHIARLDSWPGYTCVPYAD